MATQRALTDFSVGLLCGRKRVYFTLYCVLEKLAGRTTLCEVRGLLGLSKQALNKHLRVLTRKGWVERLGFGVYEVTPEGLRELRSKVNQPIASRLPVIEKSVHHWRQRFNLKGWRFDRAGLRKSRKGHWVDYLDSEGVTIEATRKALFVDVHGLRGVNALEIARAGAERARIAALGFCARRGARVYAVGEVVQAPHWVLEDKEVSKALVGWLDLREGKTVQAGGLAWFTDKSHEGYVEAKGEVSAAVAAFKEFDYLVSSGLHRDLELIKSELVSVKDVAKEVKALREDLVFRPSGLPRRDTS